VALSLGHAVLTTPGLLVVWAVRTLIDANFARGAEAAWLWALLLWPVWWLGLVAINPDRRSRVLKPLLLGTVVWLLSAIPALALFWSLRGFHSSRRVGNRASKLTRRAHGQALDDRGVTGVAVADDCDKGFHSR